MQEEIIVENGIKSILQKIFDYYYSYKRTCKTVALGGLIPLATNEANGLMSKNNYIKIAQSITSTKLIKIESWDGYSTLVFIRTNGATGLYSIDGNWAGSAKFTKLSGPLGKDHFNAYREVNGNIYVKTTKQSEPLTVTSVGSNHVFKFEESDKDVDSLIVLQ